MSSVKSCSKEVSFNIKRIGAEGEVVGMDKFEEIQQLTQQLRVHGGSKHVNDSSSDKEMMRTRILNQTHYILRSLLLLAQRYQQTLCTQ